MLFLKTIAPTALELLKELQKDPFLHQCRLVGGTSLALQLGHRNSIDLDFFGVLDVDELFLSKQLQKYGQPQLIHKTQNIFIYSINGIKVDFVNYHYPWIEKAVIEDGLVLAQLPDIAAMKLSAITGRGSKKDFIDLYYLLKKISFKEMLKFYEKKYNDGSVFLVLKSLAYFDDAENDPMPKMFDNISWATIKKSILIEIDSYT